MNETKKMLYFMRKRGEYTVAVPVDLKNDQPAKLITYVRSGK